MNGWKILGLTNQIKDGPVQDKERIGQNERYPSSPKRKMIFFPDNVLDPNNRTLSYIPSRCYRLQLENLFTRFWYSFPPT